MPQLVRCFESAGFTNVRTVLASGNVAFDARSASEHTLERKAESSMQDVLGRSFYTIVRSVDALHSLLDGDPYAAFALPANAKRVVSFMREPPPTAPALPIESDGARLLCMVGREAYAAYEPSPKGPVFMTLIEKTFGKDVTTRTWETLKKCAAA
jgi:uncharacterized protein (DUF1697 family)